MPAFMAHYTCGVLVQHELFGIRSEKAENSFTANALTAHQNVYHVGLAGPDLFFYSLYEQAHKGMKLGRAIHKYRTDQFLQTLFKETVKLKGEERNIALAYFAGYVGHYCLDSSTHPYIYRVCDHPDEGIALGKHFRFEAAMDVLITEKYLGRDIHHAHLMGLIRMSGLERRVIAQLLAKAIHMTYPDTPSWVSPLRIRIILMEYSIINNLLIDPTGLKEWLVLTLEKRLRGYSLLSSLCINDHLYGVTEEDFRRFDRRFLRGVRYFRNLLPLIDASVSAAVEEMEKEKNLTQLRSEKLFSEIGSRSYHTGRHRDGRATEINWE